ncbi:ShET2/EspL2 family type III secretion system effector toxin [Candidatus Ichthyocystis sparus]|uniref:ShET2/EspL2 family type III secretion system effector toxin n=1 Tax=Candidatus Ichthyocystis sparus TaxID=1561004 RepID=UPI000B876B99|nr:ShET2/EspL2 family type III secretion system effector toxin [Candidatus Ichthyocystis sparus]
MSLGVHLLSHSMTEAPSCEKDVPYISKKYPKESLNLNNKAEVNGKVVTCSELSSLFVLNSIDFHRNKTKLKISDLFSDKDSVKEAVLSKFEEVNENIVIKNSCGRHVIICDKFGDFLHRTASTMTSGEQRLFTLHSCNHVMSFKIVRKAKEIEGVSSDRWVVHFFDPNKTIVLARSEVLRCEEFLDQSKFSLRMFIYQNFYRIYFEVNPGWVETECAVYEYSDTREAISSFSTLDTLSQDGISGCMMFHIMSNNICSLNIREIVKSKSFSTLSASARRDVFFAKSSGGVPGLFFASSENNYNSIKSYSDFLEELSSDEQLSLLPRIIRSESPEGVPSLFIAMQENSFQSINAFGLLIDRLMNLRSKMSIDDFCRVLSEILLAARKEVFGNFSALSTALCRNNAEAVMSYGSILDRIFMLKGDIGSRELADIIFNLLNYKDMKKNTALLYGLKNGCSNAVRAFGSLLDRLIFMKGHIPNTDMVRMIFSLLSYDSEYESSRLPMHGLFFALANGHSDSVRAFSELVDRLLVMRGCIPDEDMADMIYRLINPSYNGDHGLFFALANGHSDTVLALGEMISSKFMLLSGCVSERGFSFMMLRILSAMNSNNMPGIFASLLNNNVDVVEAYASLLIHASKVIRRRIFCIKDRDGSPAIYRFMECDEPESFIAYDHFLQSLSCDEQMELLPELLTSKNKDGDPALFLAMQEERDSCIGAYSTLMEKQLMKIKERVPNDDFAGMIFGIALAKRSDGISALFMGMYRNRASAIRAYSILLDKVLVLLRGTVSDDKLSEFINNLISYCTPSYDESPLLIALRRGYSHSVFAFGLLIDRLMLMKDCISNDKLSNMIFNLLKARTSKDIDGLFMAFQKGYTDTVNAFGSLLDKLIGMKGHIESDALVDMTFDLLTCKRDSDNVSGLFMAMYKGHHKTVDTFGELLDKVLLALKGTVPDDKFARLIFKLLKARASNGVDGLFMALQEGNSNAVLSFISLLDRLLSLKGFIEDTTLVGMVFDLLMCKSCDDSIPGLFVAMKNGHHVAVDTFGKLLEKLMMFKDDISTGYFNNMLLDLVASRRSDGVSGLFVALENDFPEVVKSYISLLKLIPKDELVNVLVASDSSGRPAALLAGSNALEAYFAMVSEFTTKTIYALHSQLSSTRRSIEHILVGDSNLDGKYKLLLEKVKELARSSRQSHYSLQ